MIQLTTTQKKLALLRGRLVFEKRFKGTDVKTVLGKDPNLQVLSQKNLTNWCNGGDPTIGSLTLSNAVASEYKLTLEDGELISHDIIGGSMGVREFGALLKLTPEQINYYIDDLIFRTLPTVTMNSFEKDPADKFIRDYGGFYIIYRAERGENGEISISQIPLCIRYLVGSDKQSAQNMFRIRCKARVPTAEGVLPDFYEYDGTVSFTNEAWYWTFEMREKERALKDMTYIVTDKPARILGDERESLRGHMISSTQSNVRAGHWPTLIVRDGRYSRKKDSIIEGHYVLDDGSDADHFGTEKAYFNEHCKIVSFADFEDKAILQSLMSAGVG